MATVEQRVRETKARVQQNYFLARKVATVMGKIRKAEYSHPTESPHANWRSGPARHVRCFLLACCASLLLFPPRSFSDSRRSTPLGHVPWAQSLPLLLILPWTLSTHPFPFLMSMTYPCAVLVTLHLQCSELMIGAILQGQARPTDDPAHVWAKLLRRPLPRTSPPVASSTETRHHAPAAGSAPDSTFVGPSTAEVRHALASCQALRTTPLEG